MSRRPDHFFVQSGAVPYRGDRRRLEVLLVRNRKDTKWICPKGIVEPHLTPELSAAQEAYEEAGVLGVVHSVSLGRYKQKKWGGVCKIDMFPMRVTTERETWLESYRRRKWFALGAAEEVCDPRLKPILAALPETLAQLTGDAPSTVWMPPD